MRAHPAAEMMPLMAEARLRELVESIRANGQREPIVLFEGKILDGRNRFEACTRLGIQPKTREWSGADSPWRYVWDQNAERRDLEPGQRTALRLKFNEADEKWLSEQEERRTRTSKARVAAGKRTGGGPQGPRPPGKRGKNAEAQVRARDALAKSANTSPTTAKRVLAVRSKAPDLFEKVVTGEVKLSQATREMKKREIAKRIKEQPPEPAPEGPFDIIVLDPPWRYDTSVESGSKQRGLVDYADMSIEEICALPVAKLAGKNAVLWLWTTNSFMRQAYQCLDAWGFEEKTILTWDKVKMGAGHWLRNVTEHCLLAVRGRPQIIVSTQTTLIRESRREHSRKPEAFYALVESLCVGSKLEMFSRTKRKGWAGWGAEAERFG